MNPSSFQVITAPFRPHGQEPVDVQDVCAMAEEAAFDCFLPHRREAVMSKRSVVALALQLPQRLAEPLFTDTAVGFSLFPISDAQYVMACNMARVLYTSASTFHQKSVMAALLCFLRRSHTVARLREPFFSLSSLAAMRLETMHADGVPAGPAGGPTAHATSSFARSVEHGVYLRAAEQANCRLSAVVQMFRQLSRADLSGLLAEDEDHPLDVLRLCLAEQPTG